MTVHADGSGETHSSCLDAVHFCSHSARDSRGGDSGSWSPNPPQSLQTLQLLTPKFEKKEEAPPWSPEFKRPLVAEATGGHHLTLLDPCLCWERGLPCCFALLFRFLAICLPSSGMLTAALGLLACFIQRRSPCLHPSFFQSLSPRCLRVYVGKHVLTAH